MVVRFDPILPKQKITAQYLPNQINRWLRITAKDFIQEMQEYPEITPWQSILKKTKGRQSYPQYPTRPHAKSTGLGNIRAGGRRTGRYAQGWNLSPGTVFTKDSFISTNSVPYAVYVGGPRRGSHIPGKRQAKHMTLRGWKSISIGRLVIKRNLPRLRKLILPYKP